MCIYDFHTTALRAQITRASGRGRSIALLRSSTKHTGARPGSGHWPFSARGAMSRSVSASRWGRGPRGIGGSSGGASSDSSSLGSGGDGGIGGGGSGEGRGVSAGQATGGKGGSAAAALVAPIPAVSAASAAARSTALGPAPCSAAAASGVLRTTIPRSALFGDGVGDQDLVHGAASLSRRYAQSIQGSSAATSPSSTVAPHHTRSPGGASR